MVGCFKDEKQSRVGSNTVFSGPGQEFNSGFVIYIFPLPHLTAQLPTPHSVKSGAVATHSVSFGGSCMSRPLALLLCILLPVLFIRYITPLQIALSL